MLHSFEELDFSTLSHFFGLKMSRDRLLKEFQLQDICFVDGTIIKYFILEFIGFVTQFLIVNVDTYVFCWIFFQSFVI